VSKAEKWGVAAAIAGIIGVVVAIIAIFVAHHDSESTQASTRGNPATMDPSFSSSAARSSAPPVSAIPATPDASPTTPALVSSNPSPQYFSLSFADLCSSNSATQNSIDDCLLEKTQKIGQNVYSFSTFGFAHDPASGGWKPLLSFPSTTCRTISLRFAIQLGSGIPSGLRITVSVVSRGSQSATVGPNQLGVLNATLDGGPFEIDASANMPYGSGWGILMDGSASCSTRSGS
jgi:hypothetical protein